MTRKFSSLCHWSLLLIAAAFPLVQACGDNGVAPTKALVTLALAPTTVTVARGASTTTTITITRTQSFIDGGFPQVLLHADNLPEGVTAAFNPLSPTGDTSTLTLTASSTATTGTVNVTIRGVGSYTAAATVGLSVTVTGG